MEVGSDTGSAGHALRVTDPRSGEDAEPVFCMVYADHRPERVINDPPRTFICQARPLLANFHYNLEAMNPKNEELTERLKNDN